MILKKCWNGVVVDGMLMATKNRPVKHNSSSGFFSSFPPPREREGDGQVSCSYTGENERSAREGMSFA
jgi:hypothetical protein